MADPKDKNFIAQDRIHDPIIADPELAKARESPFKHGISIRLFHEIFFYPVEDAAGLRFGNPLKVSPDGPFISDIKGQGILSGPFRT
jgi:hypothetical protein